MNIGGTNQYTVDTGVTNSQGNQCVILGIVLTVRSYKEFLFKGRNVWFVTQGNSLYYNILLVRYFGIQQHVFGCTSRSTSPIVPSFV